MSHAAQYKMAIASVRTMPTFGLSVFPQRTKPMAQHHPPRLDRTPRTLFLRLTIARAMTPRTLKRVYALRELERLLAIAADGHQLGVRGFLLASIGRDYPVSKRAMDLELRGYGPQRLVEAAEQIELKLWVQPHAHRKS